MLPQRAGRISMYLLSHLRFIGKALKQWFNAQCQDALVVGCMWLAGLHMLRVPWAPLWAGLAAILQFVPHLGPVLGLVGPLLAATFTWRDWRHPLVVLMLYAGIVLLDGFVLHPYIMRRAAKVPIWASILAPVVLSFLAPWWGILLAPPLLAVAYAYVNRPEKPES